MQVQKVQSNQNFNGQVKFVNRHFVTRPFDKISEYLPEKLGKSLETVNNKIKDADFDVFVMRDRENVKWFQILADKEYPSTLKQKPVFVDETVLKSVFGHAVDSAIEAFLNATAKIHP